MTQKKRALAFAAPVVALAIVAAACGGGGDKKSGSGDKDTSAASSSAASSGASKSSAPSKTAAGGNDSTGAKLVDINATPYDQVKDGGTFTQAIDQMSTQWNYNQLNGPEASTNAVTSPLMPTTYLGKADGTIVNDPDYVTSWKLVTAPKQVVTYELNPKAKWSNGTSITAADFIAQYKALNGKTKGYDVASTTGYDRIGTVAQGKTKFEVVVTFAKPYSDWTTLFSPLYPAATNSTPAAFNKSYLNKIPVTAGPFKLSKLDLGAKTVTLVRNPAWWGRKPKLDSLVFRTLTIQATPDAFANGEIDTFDVGPDRDAYKRAKGVKNSAIRESGSLNFRHVTFNGTSPTLKDVNVRKAVEMAIDRGAIAKSDLEGLGWSTSTLNNHIYMPGQKGYQDNAGDAGKYDKDAAGKLLDNAGWKMDGQYRKKAGKVLNLSLVIPTGVPVSANEATLITAMLGQVGVKVTTNAVPSDPFFDDYVSPGKFDLTVFSWLGGIQPISGAVSLYQKPTGNDIHQNFARIGTTEIDSSFNAALEMLDPAKQIVEANKIDSMIWQQVMILPFYQRPTITAVKSNLVNFGSATFLSTDYTSVGFSK